MRIFAVFCMVSLILFFCACGGDSGEDATGETRIDSALDYFDQLTNPMRHLVFKYHKVHRTSMNLTSNIRPSRILEGVEKFENNLEELQKLTTEIADKVAALQDFKGDKSFRNAALDYLEHLENYVYIDAPEYISLIRNYAERYNEIEKEEVNAINKIVDKMNSESDFQGNKFEKAQSVFAKKYNFRLFPGKILH